VGAKVVKVMGKGKALVKVGGEGKYVVDIEKEVPEAELKPTVRVALRNDSYALHKVLPNKVDALVSLMRVEKVPDSTYDMIGGLDKQIKGANSLLGCSCFVSPLSLTVCVRVAACAQLLTMVRSGDSRGD
jgi:26S proteasome regulatory subunit T6